MKLEKLYSFPLLHKASLKKNEKVKKGFSDIATLHFQNYSGCDTPLAKSPCSYPQPLRGGPWSAGGAGGGHQWVRPRWTRQAVRRGRPNCEGASIYSRLSKRLPLLKFKSPHEGHHLTLPGAPTPALPSQELISPHRGTKPRSPLPTVSSLNCGFITVCVCSARVH